MKYSINAKDDPDWRCDKAHCQSFSWTTESPTQEGWYWFLAENDEEPCIVNVIKASGFFWIDGEHLVKVEEYKNALWLGALPVPDLPKGF